MFDRAFANLRLTASNMSEAEIAAVHGVPAGVRGAAPTGEDFADDEEAARFYLDRILGTAAQPEIRGLVGGDAGTELRFERAERAEPTRTRVLRFVQTAATIPVFGSHAAVEIGQAREFVSADLDVAAFDDAPLVPTIAPGAALSAIAAFAGVDVASFAGVRTPELWYYPDDATGRFRLVYLFRNIPAAPASDAPRRCCAGPRLSPREHAPVVDYLVDAEGGTVLFHYRSSLDAGASDAAPTPTASNSGAAGPPLLTECRGRDEFGIEHKFWGSPVAGGGFELSDPLRKVRTYDFALKDIGQTSIQYPEDPIRSAAADLGDTQRAAVSAHVNATRVQDFYRSVLIRESVDGKGMVLVSLVNCTYEADTAPPVWENAVWWNSRMWYGQRRDGARLRSYASLLDIIAHELTHGITEHTANLVYRNQSGALNESFSDIFGVIVNNWYNVGADTCVDGWSWEIGADFLGDGAPLRDLCDPTRAGYPAHMDNFLHTTGDDGGVHTNSNIHNKAAYNVLTAVGPDGAKVFTAREVAVLYYLCLLRLSPLADFKKALRALLDAAGVYYLGDAATRTAKQQAITDAYAKVGIVP
jgi:bacillolysin